MDIVCIPRSDADDASSPQIYQELHFQQNMEHVATDRTDCMLVAVSCQSETYMQHLHHEFMRGMYVKFIDWNQPVLQPEVTESVTNAIVTHLQKHVRVDVFARC